MDGLARFWNGWLGKLGWLETVTPVMGGELGVNRVGTSPIKVEWVGIVGSKMSSGFDMTGFYWDLGWRLGSGFKVQEKRFWKVLEGVDNLGQGTNRGFVGKLGWMGLVVVTPMVLVAG